MFLKVVEQVAFDCFTMSGLFSSVGGSHGLLLLKVPTNGTKCWVTVRGTVSCLIVPKI